MKFLLRGNAINIIWFVNIMSFDAYLGTLNHLNNKFEFVKNIKNKIKKLK